MNKIKVCWKCFKEKTKACWKCLREIPKDATHCPHCGKKQS